MTAAAVLWAAVCLMAAWAAWRIERAAAAREADRAVAIELQRLFSTEGW